MLRKITVFFVAIAIATMATPVFADQFTDEMASVDQYKGRVDKYFESVKVYEGAVNNKNRIADERLNDLEAREQQQSPPAGQFWPEPAQPQPAVVAVPVPVPAPTWGWRYYRYWNPSIEDWVFAPIWCPVGWAPPYGWYSVNYVDRYQFRHFSRGWVRGGLLSYDRPVDLHPHGVFHGNRAGANNVHANIEVARPQSRQQVQPHLQQTPRPPQNFQQAPPQNFGRAPQQQIQPRPQNFQQAPPQNFGRAPQNFQRQAPPPQQGWSHR